MKLRKTYIVREVLKIGKMQTGEPYVSSMDKLLHPSWQSLLNSLCPPSYTKTQLEEQILELIGAKPGDKMEFVVSCRIIEK